MNPTPLYVAVKAVIVKDERLLLLKKPDKKGGWFWDLAGGRINPSEKIQEALDRELHEELPSLTSYTVTRLLGARKKDQPLDDGNEICFLYYHLETPSFEIVLSQEHTEWRWMTLEELSHLPYPQDSVYSYLLTAVLAHSNKNDVSPSPFIL